MRAPGWGVRLSRSITRRVVEPWMWDMVDEELTLELEDRAARGRSRWENDLWGSAQYLSVATRVCLDRLVALGPTDLSWDGALRGGWGLDFKTAFRSLRVRPVAASTVVATIALAVGVSTAVFSVVEGVLLRRLPYSEPDRLVRVWQTRPDWREADNATMRRLSDRIPPQAPTVREWRESSTGFGWLGAYSDVRMVLQRGDGAELIRGQQVEADYFAALDAEVAQGRRLLPRDDAPGAERVAVVSAAFRRAYLGGERDPLGAQVVLDGVAHTVVGVMPPGFRSLHGSVETDLPPGDPLVWTALDDEAWNGDRSVDVIGRLTEGISIEVARDRLALAQDGVGQRDPTGEGKRGVRVAPLRDSVVDDVRSTLWLLLASVVLVLVVAIVNIVNVLTALGMSRRRELAVRSALGAGAGRLVRGLFVESAVLTALGGIGGLLLAWLSLPVFLRVLPTTIPRLDLVSINVPVLAFGLVTTGSAALLVGMLPAILAARTQPHEVLRSSGRSGDARRTSRLRSALVVAEVSLAFVLMASAALLVGSFQRLWTVQRGFDPTGLAVVRVEPDPHAFPTREDARGFNLALKEGLERIPGVRASATNTVPLSGRMASTSVELERAGSPFEMTALLSVGAEDYFDVVGIPIVSGRAFQSTDTPEAPGVAVVNRTLAETAWPGEDPIGQRLRADSERWIQVVGVAEDVRHQGLDVRVEPKVYLPAAQSDRDTYEWVLRIRGDVPAALRRVRDAVHSVSTTTPVGNVSVLEDTIAGSVAVPRFRMVFLSGLAALATGLALLGVYGVLSHTVTQRAREIAVRLAIGARPQDVVVAVVGSGLKLVGAGVLLGLVLAWRGASWIEQFLFEITPGDVPTHGLILLALVGVAVSAAYGPARRAATLEPMRVLSEE